MKSDEKKILDHLAQDPRKLEYDRILAELQLSEALDAAIKYGKEFATILECEKPVTKCLVAYTLAGQYRKRFPKIFEAFEKLGL